MILLYCCVFVITIWNLEMNRIIRWRVSGRSWFMFWLTDTLDTVRQRVFSATSCWSWHCRFPTHKGCDVIKKQNGYQFTLWMTNTRGLLSLSYFFFLSFALYALGLQNSTWRKDHLTQWDRNHIACWFKRSMLSFVYNICSTRNDCICTLGVTEFKTKTWCAYRGMRRF